MPLSDDDLKFVLSVDPDDDALNKAINSINAEIDQAQITMKKIALEADPSALRQRIEMEKKVADARKNLDKQEQAERVNQAGGPLGYIGEQLKGLFGGGKKGGGTAGLLAGILGGQGGGGTLGQIGGIVGGAMGGIPGGAVIGSEIAEALPKILAGPMKLVTAGARSFADSLRELQGPLGPAGLPFLISEKLGTAFSGLMKSIPVVGELLGPMLDQIAMMPGILKDVTLSLTSMTEKASPALMRQFNFAIEDAQATIGQAFIPMLDLMRQGIETFADVIANFIPNTQEVRDALDDASLAFAEIRSTLTDLAAEMGPFIRTEILATLQVLAIQLRVFAEMLKLYATVMEPFLALQNSVLRALGMGGDDTERGRTTAARTPTMGGIDEYQRRLQLQTAGGPATIDPNAVPKGVNSLVEMVGTISEWFKKMTKDQIVMNISEGVAGLAKKGVQDAIRNAENLIPGRRGGGGAIGAAAGGAGG